VLAWETERDEITIFRSELGLGYINEMSCSR
jgi:hypothetical protein